MSATNISQTYCVNVQDAFICSEDDYFGKGWKKNWDSISSSAITFLKETTACTTSFFPKPLQCFVNNSTYRAYCEPMVSDLIQKITPTTDNLMAPIKKAFKTVFSFHSLPKLPQDITQNPTLHSFATTAFLTMSFISSVTLPLLSLISANKDVQLKRLESIVPSAIKGLLLGVGSSLTFGLNPYLGGGVGAVSMTVMEGIYYRTSQLRYWGTAILYGMGIMNCAHVLHQDFEKNDRDVESFTNNLMIGDTLNKVQFESNKLSSLGWKLYAMSFLPYSATAYLSIATQSPTWRNDTLRMWNNTQQALPTWINQTYQFAQSPSWDSLNICNTLKKITPNTISFIPDWCFNSYAFTQNMNAEAPLLWQHTVHLLAGNNTIV